MNSDAFTTLWRTSLRTAHSQLLRILRHDRGALALTGSALQVDVPVTADLLLENARLPRSLDRGLPPVIPTRITLLTNAALSRASTAVRLTDTLNRQSARYGAASPTAGTGRPRGAGCRPRGGPRPQLLRSEAGRHIR